MHHDNFGNNSQQLDTIGLESVMKSFNFSLYYNPVEIKDVFDVQNIMKEGRMDDLIKCIQSILSYSFNAYTSNSNVKVLDSSFIKFFHTAQFIIQFLLHWKSELSKENIELRRRIEELDKVRKDCFSKKLEIKDLKKRLSKYEKSDDKPTSVLECSQCRKLFVNSIFLYAHHKRRHPDKPFTDIEKENEIKILKDKIQELNEKLNTSNNEECGKASTSSAVENVRTPMTPLKMKISPELSCLETQEKFWRGKLKDVYDSFEKEKQSMKNFLNELNEENSRLKEKLASIQSKPQNSSVAVQTSIPIVDEIYQDQRILLFKQFETLQEHTSQHLTSCKCNMANEKSIRVPKILHQIPLSSSMNSLNLPLENDHTSSLRYLTNNRPTNINQMKSPSRKTEIQLQGDNVDLMPKTLISTFTAAKNLDLLDDVTHALSTPKSDCYVPGLSKIEEIISDQPVQVKTDIVDQVDSFLAKYKYQKERKADTKSNEDITSGIDYDSEEKKVILKFFTSEQLADKLIKIYDKRRSLVPSIEEPHKIYESENTDIVVNAGKSASPRFNNSSEHVASNLQINEVQIFDNEQQSNKSKSQTEHCFLSDMCDISTSKLSSEIEDETTAVMSLSSSVPKEKKFLLFFRNIPSKIVKNYSKSRKICADIGEKIVRKLPNTSQCETEKVTATHNSDSQRLEETPSDKPIKSQSTPLQNSKITITSQTHIPVKNEECELISALKKSKSTGSMKKVAFVDDFPSFKTFSATDLRQLPSSIPVESRHENFNSSSADTVHVPYDECVIKPIPAPRNKKNIFPNNRTYH